jgi:hypothetical protein
MPGPVIDLKNKLKRLGTPTKSQLTLRSTALDVSPTPRQRNRYSPAREVERIVSPVKLQPSKLFFNREIISESGYEGSSQDTQPCPSTKDEFLGSFAKLSLLFKEQPINTKVVNKILKKLSTFDRIPGPTDIQKLSSEKVS